MLRSVCRLTRPLVLALAAATMAAAAEPPARSAPPAGRAATGGAYPLVRATPAEVKARLGDPAVANEEGKGALWTYRLADCALMVFFKDEGGGLRVSSVATGPRRRGTAAPDAETCIARGKG